MSFDVDNEERFCATCGEPACCSAGMVRYCGDCFGEIYSGADFDDDEEEHHSYDDD